MHEWEIDADHSLTLHQPTRALFAIYPAPGTDPDKISVYDLRSRLCHVCNAYPVPSNLAALGAQAINAFVLLTDLPFLDFHDAEAEHSTPKPPTKDDIPF